MYFYILKENGLEFFNFVKIIKNLIRLNIMLIIVFYTKTWNSLSISVNLPKTITKCNQSPNFCILRQNGEDFWLFW